MVTRIVTSLNASSKEIENSLYDFSAACINREMIGKSVILSDSVKHFRESGRALLNEVDNVLVGIDKRRLFERWNSDMATHRTIPEFDRIRADLPTMQIGGVGFLNGEENTAKSAIKPKLRRTPVGKVDLERGVCPTLRPKCPNSSAKVNEKRHYNC